jgi:NhaA family Na+:H+ antiporter
MPIRRSATAIRHFLNSEAAGGYVLMASAALALVVANSSLSEGYFHALHIHIGHLSLLHWINDGLMALFFLLVGLEIKREMIDGEMSTWPRRILPGAAALGGMLVPALIYLAVNWSVPANRSGWAIPAATDIAFALGVLALIGSRVPASLKLLLTAIAIIDDLGAIIIIAVAYTAHLDFDELGLAIAGIAVLVALNRFGVRSLVPYLLIGGFVWYEVQLSGVHATLAGVAVAMTIPLKRTIGMPEDAESPLIRLEHALAPLVAFVIVPIFGFANAGVDLRGMGLADAVSPVPLGVALGLVLGKQIGVFGAIAALVRFRLADMPARASWRQIWGLSVLCGIGFTMSLFIAALAFGEGSPMNEVAKLGILAGSGLAALAGYAILVRAPAGDRSGAS